MTKICGTKHELYEPDEGLWYKADVYMYTTSIVSEKALDVKPTII